MSTYKIMYPAYEGAEDITVKNVMGINLNTEAKVILFYDDVGDDVLPALIVPLNGNFHSVQRVDED